MRTTTKTLDYIRSLYAPEDTLLQEINAALSERQLSWQIGAEEGRLLQVLMGLHGTKTVVEIGTLAGYSTVWLARALAEGGHVYTLEKNTEHAALARAFIARSDVADCVTLLEGDAHEQLQSLNARGPFDMVLIDADKPSYNAYLDWAEQHVHPGGMILSDNTLLFGSVLEDTPPERPAASTWEGMKRFNQRLADRRRFDSIMIPTEQGLTVSIVK